jgi:hypothetical protein
MAISRTEAAMYAYITGRVLPKGTTRTAFKALVGTAIRAAQLVAPVAGRAAATGLPAAAGLAANYPVATGAALGAGFLATPPGQAVLDMAEAQGREDRIRFNAALDLMGETLATPQGRAGARAFVKKKTSKYNKAIKGGMAAVKASNFIGKKGTVSNAKKAFTTVSKVTSKVNKGKKVSTKGVTGLIARTVRKIL